MKSVLLTLMLWGIVGHASWDARDLSEVGLVHGMHLQQLETEEFHHLKSTVIDYLNGSWCSKEKATLIMELIMLERPKVCVEVGVFTGSSLLPIGATLKYVNHGKVYAVDAWSNEEAVLGLTEGESNYVWWSSLDMRGIYYTCVALIRSFELFPYCTVLIQPSRDAVAYIGEPIDFLHLDGNFSQEESLKDVTLYLPKVRKGGYILISNVFYTINEQHLRFQSLVTALDSCVIVCGIDGSNSVLLKKL